MFDRNRVLIGLAVAGAALLSRPALGAGPPASRFLIEVEGGAVFQSRNNVEIPNDGTATRFSLKDLVGEGPWPAGRVYVTYNINPKHSLRGMAAPLSYTETGMFGEAERFAGAQYQPQVPTEATYQFNSWRIGYRYTFVRNETWTWRVGLTAKIRDAKVELAQGATTSKDTDIGFVPLVHLSGERRLSESWRLLADIEALGGGPGRAEDASLKIGYNISEKAMLTAGYR
ncbi:MAG: hypothetical protein HKN12_00750, partial [Gemmatimonadetes bacterium]|nr:hypothetical protein [Gemmatimonadota bacterium]